MGSCMKASPEERRVYSTFLKDCGARCWICGRSPNDRPPWWHAPFRCERAHMDKVNHPRRESRKCCLILCSLHHRIQHGDRFPQCSDQRLTLSEQLAIKKAVDPDYYDRDFLKTCMVGDPKKLYLPPAASYLRARRLSWAVRQIKPNQPTQSSGVPGEAAARDRREGDELGQQEDSRP